MYILFNNDGSIKKLNLTEFIQQGNDNANHIFVSIAGKDQAEWAATGYFELPNNDVELLTATPAQEEIDGITYRGWSVPISSNVTIYEGDVYFTLSIQDLQGVTLNTYQGTLVINPAPSIPDETTITIAQYNALLRYVLGATQSKAEIDNIIYVFNNSTRPESFSRFTDGQIFFNESNKKFYKLSNGTLVEYTIFNPEDEFLTIEDHDYVIPPEDR